MPGGEPISLGYDLNSTAPISENRNDIYIIFNPVTAEQSFSIILASKYIFLRPLLVRKIQLMFLQPVCTCTLLGIVAQRDYYRFKIQARFALFFSVYESASDVFTGINYVKSKLVFPNLKQ